jgi:hypothetical protein
MGDDVQYSEKMQDDLYDIMGEKERLLKENKALSKDYDAFKRVIGEKEVSDKRFLSLAKYLKDKSRSKIDVAVLANMLKSDFNANRDTKYMWDDMMMGTHDIARQMLEGSLPVSADQFTEVMKKIRKDKITLSDKQKAKIVELYGQYGDFHRLVFGRVSVGKDGMALSEAWKKWSAEYPEIFDPNISEENQLEQLIDIVQAMKYMGGLNDSFERAEAIRYLATEIYNQYWNIVASASESAKESWSGHKKLMADLRSNYERRQAEANVHPIGENALKLKKIMEQNKAKISDAKALGKQKLSEYKESAERKVMLQKIYSVSEELAKAIEHPTKDKHVPEFLHPFVNYVLESFDYSSAQLLGEKGKKEDRGTPTKKDKAILPLLESLHSNLTR